MGVLASFGDSAESYPTCTVQDVLCEHALGRPLTAEQVYWFAKRRVRDAALNCEHPLLIDDVAFLPAGRFEFARYVREEVIPAIIIVVRGCEGPIDLLAWQPRTNQQALWTGRAFALGEEQVYGPFFGNEPLAVWRTPLSWLRAARRGLVIIRPQAALFYLNCVPALVAEDLAHAEVLERFLIPQRPTTEILLRVAAKSEGSSQ